MVFQPVQPVRRTLTLNQVGQPARSRVSCEKIKRPLHILR